MKDVIRAATVAFLFALFASWSVRGQERKEPTEGSWEWQDTAAIKKSANGDWTVGTAALRFTDKTLRGFYHEKFEYVDGRLRILKPVWIECGSHCEIATSSPGAGHLRLWGASWTDGFFFANPDPESTRSAYLQGEHSKPRKYGEWIGGNILAKPEPQPQAESEPPKSICGMDKPQYTANIDLVQVSCLDFDEMRRMIPSIPWPAGKKTQVLVHIRAGDAVKITLGDQILWADLQKDAWGRLVALLQFDGGGFAVAPKVQVFSETK